MQLNSLPENKEIKSGSKYLNSCHTFRPPSHKSPSHKQSEGQQDAVCTPFHEEGQTPSVQLSPPGNTIIQRYG